MKTHRDLVVWQRAIGFVDHIYDVSGTFPRDEMYGLVSQIRRAAVSVPANIAEGSARNSSKEFAQFIAIARGSLAEIETFLIIALRRRYISETRYNALTEEYERIGKMLTGLHRSIKFPKNTTHHSRLTTHSQETEPET